MNYKIIYIKNKISPYRKCIYNLNLFTIFLITFFYYFRKINNVSFKGVRIIIDIFFDKKDSEIDIVGSRVETDIPESRILSDFQQHSLDMKNQELKPGIQDGSSTPKSA